eukprot:6938315-Alexandrium_andersonii.AAC.1
MHNSRTQVTPTAPHAQCSKPRSARSAALKHCQTKNMRASPRGPPAHAVPSPAPCSSAVRAVPPPAPCSSAAHALPSPAP